MEEFNIPLKLIRLVYMTIRETAVNVKVIGTPSGKGLGKEFLLFIMMPYKVKQECHII